MKTLLILLACISLGACMSFSDRHFRPIRDSLSAQLTHVNLEKEMALSVGGMVFKLVDLISDEADFSALEHLRVAVYQVQPRARQNEFVDAVFEFSLRADSPDLSWERIVRVRKPGEQVWVFAGMGAATEQLEELSVFVLEDGELTMLNLAGDLNDLLEHALAPARGQRGDYWRS